MKQQQRDGFKLMAIIFGVLGSLMMVVAFCN